MVVLSIVILVFGGVLCFSPIPLAIPSRERVIFSHLWKWKIIDSSLCLYKFQSMRTPTQFLSHWPWASWRYPTTMWRLVDSNSSPPLGASLQLLKWKNKKTISWNDIQPPATASWTTTIQIYDICPSTSIYKWKNTSPLLVKESHQFPVICSSSPTLILKKAKSLQGDSKESLLSVEREAFHVKDWTGSLCKVSNIHCTGTWWFDTRGGIVQWQCSHMPLFSIAKVFHINHLMWIFYKIKRNVFIDLGDKIWHL